MLWQVGAFEGGDGGGGVIGGIEIEGLGVIDGDDGDGGGGGIGSESGAVVSDDFVRTRSLEAVGSWSEFSWVEGIEELLLVRWRVPAALSPVKREMVAVPEEQRQVVVDDASR